MKLLKINLTNFRAYTGEHEFSFPTTPGLYGLTGENQANPRLGANGTGKSTLLDAVLWCLYGRTGAGLRAGEVKAWGARGVAAVTLALTVGPHSLIVSRSQGPNSLTMAIDGNAPEPTTQDAILKAIRLTYEEFTYAVMRPQGSDSFFDLSPSDKLALFSKIKKLDLWIQKSDEAKALYSELASVISNDQQRLAKLKGNAEALQANLADLTLKDQKFEAEKQQKMAATKAAAKEIAKELKFKRAEYEASKQALQGLEIRLNEAEARAKAAASSRDQAGAEKQGTRTAVNLSERDAEIAQHKLTELEAHAVQHECPTCLQPTEPEMWGDRVSNAEAEIAAALTELEAKKLADSKAGEKLALAKLDHEKAEKDVIAIKRNISDFQRKLHSDAVAVETIEIRMGSIGEIVVENPYTRMIQDQRAALTVIEGKLVRLGAKITEDEKLCEVFKFWADAFKRVRLFVIESSLKQLEIEVNSNLTSLGLVGWTVKFDVERENKSGGVTKGFTTLVTPPAHLDPARYETFSGGEKQRLRLAGDFGLANLIMEQAGLNSRIEFYDEASAGLSITGQTDLADALAERASTFRRVIFYVDHNSLDYGGYAGLLIAFKAKEGAALRWR